MVLEDLARGAFRLASTAGAEVEVREAVVERGRRGIGVDGRLVFLDGVLHKLGPAGVYSLLLVHVGQGRMVVSGAAIRLPAVGACGCCLAGRRLRSGSLRGTRSGQGECGK